MQRRNGMTLVSNPRRPCSVSPHFQIGEILQLHFTEICVRGAKGDVWERFGRINGASPDAKPWTLGGDYLWDLDRDCIYVSVCINAPGRGQFIVLYICLSCLEWLCIPDTVTGVLIELFLICNYTLFELMGPPGLSISRLYASSGGSQPWGPATSHHMVSKQGWLLVPLWLVPFYSKRRCRSMVCHQTRSFQSEQKLSCFWRPMSTITGVQ